MKKTIVSLAIAALFLTLSCATRRRCMEKFPVVSNTLRIITTRDSIVVRDTTVFIKIPGEIVHDSVPIPCPPPPASYIPDTAYAETSLTYAKAWWRYPVIKLLLVQKDTTIEQRLDSALKESYHFKSEYLKIKEVITIKEKGRLTKILWQLIVIGLIVTVIIIIPRVFKKK